MSCRPNKIPPHCSSSTITLRKFNINHHKNCDNSIGSPANDRHWGFVSKLLFRAKQHQSPAKNPMRTSYCWGYVSTANLDGETNLKLKTAPQLTQTALTSGGCPAESLSALRVVGYGRTWLAGISPNDSLLAPSGKLTVCYWTWP